ncbi:hypothetical protein KJ903_02745 [Patescibacteria group bacterium]|nr:hypothetical protein [Patescibacteria group bacterium]
MKLSPKKQLLLFFLGCLVFFSVLQFSFSGYLGHDAYYHSRVAQMIKETGGLLQSFPWLQYTILRDQFVEHHLLLHVVTIPFVSLLPPIFGGKLFTVLTAALMATTFYWLLQKLTVKSPWLWSLLLLFSSSAFIFRLNLFRAQNLALLFLFLGTYALVKRQRILLLVITFLYVWLFDGFIFLGLVAGIYALVDIVWYFQKNKKRQIKKVLTALTPLVIFGGGMIISSLLNPYFPYNIKHLYFHLYRVALHNSFSNLPVGGEWAGATPDDLLKSSLFIIILYIISLTLVVIQLINKKVGRPHRLDYFFLITATGFLLLTFVAQRLIEYCVPFVILAAASILSRFWVKYQAQIKKVFTEIIDRKSRKQLPIIIILAIFLTLYVSFIPIGNIDQMRKYVTTHTDGYREAALWLHDNTPAQSIIYHIDWGDFPFLFYYNPQNYYIGGLDPNFMLEYDQNVFDKWNKIFHQEELQRMYSVVKYDFRADYMLVTDKFPEIQIYTQEDPRFEEVYQVGKVKIYHLKDY